MTKRAPKAKKKSRSRKAKAKKKQVRRRPARAARRPRAETRAAPIENVAYHEAGHVVIAMVRDLAVNDVTIRPSRDYLGCVRKPSPMMYDRSTRTQCREIVEDFIVSSYAGFEAELLLSEDAKEELSQDDFTSAFNMPREFEIAVRGCSCVGDEAYMRYLDRRRREARALVVQHQDVIRKLGQALLKRKTMTADQAKKCVGKYLPDIDD